MDTRFITARGKYVGRISKCRLIQFIMQEERKKGWDPECKRIMLLANKKLEEYPQPMRDAAKLTLKDYRSALTLYNKNPREIPDAENNGKVPIAGRDMLPPETDNFSKEDLLKASHFLRHCGGSLSKAKQLLDFIYVLTREN